MKKIACLSCVALALIAAAGAGISQTKPSQQDQQKAMEAVMQKAMAVTENHALLTHFVGKWTGVATTWQMPGAQPMKSAATSEMTSILGGRFIMERFMGSMMNMPFEGLRVAGYDNMQKKFVTFWIDNNSTAFFLFSGTYDAAKKTFTDLSKWSDGMGGMMDVRMVTRVVSPDEHIQEMYMTMPGGKEYKGMEIDYKRVK
jgi:hypothetical protein